MIDKENAKCYIKNTGLSKEVHPMKERHKCMYERVTPEQVGISSASVKKYVSILEKAHQLITSITFNIHSSAIT